MDMGQRIKELRIEKGLTQEELAEKLGMQKSAIAKYENGRATNLKRSTIEKMCEIFDCSPSYLLGVKDGEYIHIDAHMGTVPISNFTYVSCFSYFLKSPCEFVRIFSSVVRWSGSLSCIYDQRSVRSFPVFGYLSFLCTVSIFLFSLLR